MSGNTGYVNTQLHPQRVLSLTFGVVDLGRDLEMTPAEILGALPVIHLILCLVVSPELTDAELAEMLVQPKAAPTLINMARKIAAAWRKVRDGKQVDVPGWPQ